MILFMRRPTGRLAWALAVALVLMAAGAASARAGTICGTVRDVATLAPIPQAGVFVRTLAGSYTGHHAATDAAGFYCLDGIPAGKYNLEFRRDDYQTRYVRQVEVTDEASVIDVGAQKILWLRTWPNPSYGRVELGFAGGRSVQLEIFDARGRRVRGWSGATAEGLQTVTWSFKDTRGRDLPGGVYYARVVNGRQRADARIVYLK